MGSQVPAVRSVPHFVSSKGRLAIDLAARCGLKLDPWQESVLMDALGEREDGKWASFEVGVNVARQNGKGGIIEARELASIELGDRLIIHSSHEFATSMTAMNRMEELLEEGGMIGDLKKRGGISRSHGSEGFVWRSGQRIWYRTRTKGGGRGFSSDLLFLDEAMILAEMFIGALLPTLSARSMSGNPQVWYTGSAVDWTVHENGLVFSRVRARGRSGEDPSLAYFEWSADPELTTGSASEELLGDEAAWARANPGLGIRISSEHVAKELRSMDPRTFAVERLGVGDWPSVLDEPPVIDLDAWDELEDAGSEALDPVCFAFDVTPDRAMGAIAVAGLRRDGSRHLEVVDHRRGTGWIPDRVAELVARHRPASVCCDSRGPAGSLLPALEKLRVDVRVVTAGEHAAGCGMLYDAVEDRAVWHLPDAALRAAVGGAVKRPLGDAWAWTRRGSSVDISPLVAVTLALFELSVAKPKRRPMVAVA